MHLKTFDEEAIVLDSESYFWLWCCDCDLRHLVVLEAVGNGSDKFKSEGGKIAIAFSRDDTATDLMRKKKKLVLYQRKGKNKDAKEKKS
jgi:hypothetical protein|tara:strand:+ start:327 stop:593 length:267 start_codon:yes stop_codon:yes gene_type:complete